MKDNLNTHLIVVIPAYNEVECIASVLQNWLRFLEHSLSNTTFNLLVINDGSTDGTGDLLDALAKRESRLKVIHQMNGGHGNAVLNGYRMALMHHPDFVFQVDSDDQFLPEDFLRLWKKRNDSNFITGFRKTRHDEFNRLIITRVLRLLIVMVFQCVLKDSNVPYRLIKGPYLQRLLNSLPEQPFAPNIFLSVLAKRDGQELFEIPIGHKERKNRYRFDYEMEATQSVLAFDDGIAPF